MILNGIIGAINLLIKGIGGLGQALMLLLPPSPFNVLDNMQIPYLDTLNWVMPISFMVTVLGYWVGAIALYYVVQIGLRWVKAVE